MLGNDEKNTPPSNASYRYKTIKITLAFLLLIMILGAFCLGRYRMVASDVLKILLSKIIPIERAWDATMESVVFTIRMPRIMTAVLVGGALSLSGATYQGVFKNPLVAPDFLGVSSGACVGASLMILLNTGRWCIQIGAFLGGILAVFLATTIPRLLKNNSMTILVLSGIIVCGMMSSIMGIIKYLADPEDELAEIIYWQMGSLAKSNMQDMLMILPIVMTMVIILLSISWRINILSLGENEARSLGIDIRLTRGIVIFCSTLLTASVVSISGTIGWVGLVVPHLGRMLVGPDNVKLLPVSVMLGASFMLLIDTIARVSINAEIPLSILTGIVGSPFYFWLLVKQRKRI